MYCERGGEGGITYRREKGFLLPNLTFLVPLQISDLDQIILTMPNELLSAMFPIHVAIFVS
jgi:hypothetical protein